MIKYIEHAGIILGVKTEGAELVTLVHNGKEYIWNKKEIWAKSAPILFPFIGKLKDDSYIYEGKKYDMSKHGFARDTEFKVLEEKDNMISFVISSNEVTKKVYPFDFELIIKYIIEDDKSVTVEGIVRNTGTKEMYFSLGFHPAILLPEEYSKSYLELDKKQDLKTYTLVGPLVNEDKKDLIASNSNVIQISDEIFEKYDTLIFDGSLTNTTRIPSVGLSVNHKGFQYIAYWRPQKASFICVEPWDGVSDKYDADKKLENKLGINKLNEKCEFKASLTFKFEE